MQEYLNFRVDLNDPQTVSAYDELSLWSAMFGLLLLKHLPMRPGWKVLDVGCGTGFPLLELAQRLGPDSLLIGIDPWEAAFNRARHKMEVYGLKNVELRAGDAASLPFSDCEFDLVVSNLGINNFANPDVVFAECHRVLKPSAMIALTTNLVGHMREFYAAFESTLREAIPGRALEALARHVDHRATMEKVGAMLFRNGFRVVNVKEESASMRYADGTALLNHYFIKLGFLDAWKDVVDEADREEVFSSLEANLNRLAKEHGFLNLTIPMAYVEAIRAD